MKKAFITLILLLFVVPAFAGKIFTDGDLGKYKGLPHDNEPGEVNDVINVVKEEGPDIDKWCRKWIQYQDDLEEAMKERNYTKHEWERYKASRTYVDQSLDKYQRALINVRDIEEKIFDFEYKAWRANVPKLSYECDIDEYDE